MPLPRVQSFRKSFQKQLSWEARRRPSKSKSKEEGSLRLSKLKEEGSLRLPKVISFRKNSSFRKNRNGPPEEAAESWRTLKEELLLLAASRATNHAEHTGLINLCNTFDEEDDQTVMTTLFNNNVDINDGELVAEFISKVRRERSLVSQGHEDRFEVIPASRSWTTMQESHPTEGKILEGLKSDSVDVRDDATVDVTIDLSLGSDKTTVDVSQSWLKWLMGEPNAGCCSSVSSSSAGVEPGIVG